MNEVSAEQLVAQRVDSLSQHMTENRFDVIASIAVDALQTDGLLPVAAFLNATKAAFCNHEIAVRTMILLQSQRKAADQARADAAFEHGKKMQAEREAEGLKADLAQSMLLVESQRLRIEEAKVQGAEWCGRIRELENRLQELQELQQWKFHRDIMSCVQKLETAEAALLEQQQRNEELVTQGSQQYMKIAELQRQVDADKTQELPAKTQEQPAKTQEQPAKTQELPDKTQPIQVREGRWMTRDGKIRNVTPTPEDFEVDLYPWWDAQYRQTWRANGQHHHSGESILDLVEYIGSIEEGKTQEQPAEYTPPDGWRLLEVGETLTLGDEYVESDYRRGYPTKRIGSTVGTTELYIRRIKWPEPMEMTR